MFRKLTQLEDRYSWIPYLEAVIGHICTVLLQMCMKVIINTITSLFAIYFRATALLILNSCVLLSQGKPVSVRNPRTFRLLVGRAIFSTITFLIMMVSVEYVPIAIVNSLYHMGPIFIFFVEAALEGKRIHLIQLGFTLISFSGVLLIIKPQFLFTHSHRVYELWHILLPLSSALTTSFGMYLVHQTKGLTDSTTSLQYLYLVQTLFAGVQVNFTEVKLRQPLAFSFFLTLLALCLLGYIIQTCLTRATMLKKASHIMPLGYSGILFSYLMDVLVYEVSFDWVSIAGMILASIGLLSKVFIKES